MKISKDRIASITHKVFLAMTRTAKFKLDYDNITMDNQGIFVELDGNLDYKSIADSFLEAGENVEDLADEFSKALLENKNKIKQLKNMDVEKIDKNKYKVIHDDSKNKLYLFLPKSALTVSEQDDADNVANDEKNDKDDKNYAHLVDKTITALRKFVKSNAMKSQTNKTRKSIKLSIEEDAGKGKLDDYLVLCTIKRTGDEDMIQSNVYLKVTYKNNTLYDKFVKNTFEFDEYDLVARKKNDSGILFSESDDNGTLDEIEEKIENLKGDIDEADIKAVDKFEKDLKTEKARQKIQSME